VTLVPVDARAALAPARLTVRFPADLEPGSRARLQALSANARRFEERATRTISAAAGGSSDPLELVPGDYALCVEPGAIGMAFSLAGGERRVLEVPSCALVDVTLRFVDSRTGLPVEPRFGWWSAPLAPDGSSPPDLGALPLDTHGDAATLRAPRVRIRLEMALDDLDFQSVTVDLRAGRDQIVPLDPHAPLQVELRGLDEDMPSWWLERIALDVDGRPLHPCSIASGTSGAAGDHDATMLFPAEATDRDAVLRLPPLPSYGALPERHVHLLPGETTTVRIGPEDFGIGGAEPRERR